MLVRRNLVLITALGLLSGCQNTPWVQVASRPAAAALAPAPRVLNWPDLSQLPDQVELPPAQVDPLTSYFYLTADDCRQRACQEATLANLIQQAAITPSQSHLAATRDKVDAMRRQTAYHLGREIRNRTAGGALELYYRLLEAELLKDVLDASRQEVDTLAEMAQTLVRRGMKESIEQDELQKQQIELRSEQAKLRAGIRRLNAELKALLKQEQLAGQLLPADTIQVPADDLDIEGLVQVGLDQRADLQALRQLIAGLTPETANTIKQALSQLLPPLGAIQVASRVLLPGLYTLLPRLQTCTDVEELRGQLHHALVLREQEARRTIRTAGEEWNSQRQLVIIAKHRVEFEVKQVQEFEVRKSAGKPVESDLRQARLARLKAEAELIRESIKWKIADVKTRQEMGILCPLECHGP